MRAAAPLPVPQADLAGHGRQSYLRVLAGIGGVPRRRSLRATDLAQRQPDPVGATCARAQGGGGVGRRGSDATVEDGTHGGHGRRRARDCARRRPSEGRRGLAVVTSGRGAARPCDGGSARGMEGVRGVGCDRRGLWARRAARRLVRKVGVAGRCLQHGAPGRRRPEGGGA